MPQDRLLFVYGTLVQPAMRVRLLGRPIEAVVARLPGFERGRRKHFFIVAKVGAMTEGMMLYGLTEADFRILDEYEEVPRLYSRERAEVVGENGEKVRCWIYLPTSWAAH